MRPTEKIDWLLALLYAKEKEPIDSEVRLMKELFIIRKNLHDIDDSQFYQFVPYLYGPCSFEVYKDVSKLEKDGFIEIKYDKNKRWSIFSITKKGSDYIERMGGNIPKIVEDVKNELNGIAFIELLRRVYKKYPHFAEKSILRHVVMGD
ncbi:hypothetical protein KAU34_07290 [candidate division WOR-3 bacterium]|nr:hypothetical protein [candidate division WOR-3 bacterium]